MTPEQFCYWLNGFGELTTEAPTPEQWKAIKEHLETVFAKVTPSAPGYLGQDPRRLGQAIASDAFAERNLAAMRRKEASIAPLTAAPPTSPPNWHALGLPTLTC